MNLDKSSFEYRKKDGDTTGKLVIPCIWDCASYFSDGYARVQIDLLQRGIIDKTGKLVSNFDWKNAVYGDGHYIVEKDDYLFIYDASGKRVF